MYADYEYYTAKYGGTIVKESEFPVYEKRAEAYLNMITFGNIDDVTDEVKMACCAVVDTYKRHELSADATLNGNISSEKSGSYSVSYTTGELDAQINKNRAELYDSALLYLANTGLLYRGVYG
ncbi:MAG: hypothetical protein ACOX3W_00450 [Christensenellaceae bacterium]|jgi:hypothetical protein